MLANIIISFANVLRTMDVFLLALSTGIFISKIFIYKSFSYGWMLSFSFIVYSVVTLEVVLHRFNHPFNFWIVIVFLAALCTTIGQLMYPGLNIKNE